MYTHAHTAGTDTVLRDVSEGEKSFFVAIVDYRSSDGNIATMTGAFLRGRRSASKAA